MPRFGERVLDKGVVRLLGLGHAERGLRDDFEAERGEQRFELAHLARVVRREDDALQELSARAARCAATSSPMPFAARSSMRDISSREKGVPSAVPCTSTKRPAPVITTFMSVSQPESSS